MAVAGTGVRSALMLALEHQVSGSQVGVPVPGKDANWGLLEFPVDPGQPLARVGGIIRPNEIVTSGLAQPRTLAARPKFPLAYQNSLRSCTAIPMLASMLGKPVVTQDGATNAWNYAFPLSDDPADSVSLWGLLHKGGGTKPIVSRGGKVSDVEFSAPGNAEVSFKANGTFSGDTEVGLFAAAVANTGTYAGGAICYGAVGTALAAAASVSVKVSDAALAGVIKIQVKVGSGTYSTGKISIPYSTITKIQTGWVELVDDSGPLGLDNEKTLEPLWFRLDSDVTLLAVGDVLTAPIGCQIPGTVAEGGDTTVARTKLRGQTPMFGPARVTLMAGSSSADTAVNLDGPVTLKLSRTISEVYGSGRGSMLPQALDVVGYVAAELDFEMRLEDRAWERIQRYGKVDVVQVAFPGPIISGSTSLWRELVQIDLGAMLVASVSDPLTGPGVTKLKVKLQGEEPASGTYLTAAVRSAYHWDFSVI